MSSVSSTPCSALSTTLAETRIAFRVPLSARLGLGHLRRCATLAAELKRRGCEVRFVVATDDTGATQLPSLLSETTTKLDASAIEPDATIEALYEWKPDILVIDDYSWGSEVLDAIGSRVHKVVVIDDLADRALRVDLVINAAVGAEGLDYTVGHQTRLLLGEQYALLRAEFVGTIERPAHTTQRVLVTFGGSDPQGMTPRALAAATSISAVAAVDVVLGPLAPAITVVDPRVSVHRAPQSMASLMAQADVAISAGGQTLLELAAMGVPTIGLAVADNQRPQLALLASRGVIVAADANDLATQLRALLSDQDRLHALSRSGRALVDGRGASRVADALLALSATSRAKSPG